MSEGFNPFSGYVKAFAPKFMEPIGSQAKELEWLKAEVAFMEQRTALEENLGDETGPVDLFAELGRRKRYFSPEYAVNQLVSDLSNEPETARQQLKLAQYYIRETKWTPEQKAEAMFGLEAARENYTAEI